MMHEWGFQQWAARCAELEELLDAKERELNEARAAALKEGIRSGDLQQRLDAKDAQISGLEEELNWWRNLVKRACIGTSQTPSLKAYIEQLEQCLAVRQTETVMVAEAILALTPYPGFSQPIYEWAQRIKGGV